MPILEDGYRRRRRNANATDAPPDLVLPSDGDPPSLKDALFVHKYDNHCILLPDHTHILPPGPPPFHAFLDLDALHYEQERPPDYRSDLGPRHIMNYIARAQLQFRDGIHTTHAPAFLHFLLKHIPSDSKHELPDPHQQRLRSCPFLPVSSYPRTRR